MRILLQQANTGLYFQDPNLWTGDVNAALDFGDSQRAIDYAKSQNFKDVRVLATFVQGSYMESVAFPINGAHPAAKVAHARA